MPDPARSARHASVSALTSSSKPDMSQSKRASKAVAAVSPSTKSSRPKTPAGNAVDSPANCKAAARGRKDKRFIDLSPEAKQAKRREERQQRRLALEIATPTPAPAASSTIDALVVVPTSRPPLRARRTPKRRANQWKLSHPLGGRYTTTTPVLYSADEKHLFLSQGPAIKIFSAKTSLLARTLQHLHPPPTPFPYSPSGAYSAVANYTLDPANPHQLYTLTFAGDLLLWDWTEGTIEGCWKTNLESGTYLAWCGLHAFPAESESSTTTTLWTYQESSLRDSSRKAQRQIVALTVPRTPPAPTAGECTLSATPVFTFEDSRPRNLVIVDSSTFVIDAGESFYIGNRAKNSSDWRMRKVSAPGKILTLDAIARHKKGGTTQGDVAIGDNTGRIFIYHDLLAPASSPAQNVVKSKLHWHRSAVGCIKYSKDGTYLISGGRETVLVLWQLATSSQQHLPNLGASIKSIALSPSGATYALLLADNSIVAISTTELKPRTAIAGIQSRVFQGEAYHKIYKPGGRVKKQLHANPHNPAATPSFRIPLVRNPRAANQILLAAPASQKGESAYPYLQTFDLSQDRGVAKQAITRTLASMKNTTPDGVRVVEPTVTALAVSGDGTWLASVDEWAAPARDFLDAGAPQPPRSATVGKEVTLRFWRWSAGDKNAQGSWELVSMIESPHGVDASGAAGSIADLTASPAAHSAAFASVGSDGSVKIWACRARTRAGVAVQKSDMVLWTCRRNIELFKSTQTTAVSPSTTLDARIAYAQDGSVVAVSYTDNSEDGVVAIIDPVSGTVAQEISALQTGNIFALAFADRFLVVAGARRVVAWNLVAGAAEFGCQLAAFVGRSVALDSNTFIPNIHLAVNGANVAVAVNYPLRSGVKAGGLTRAGNTASVVTVVTVPSFAVVARRKVGHGVLALESSNAGFLWLDGAANVYFLSPASGADVVGTGADGYLDDVYADVGGLANAFLEKAVLQEEEAHDDGDGDGDGKVVRSHMLARLFPGPAYASPAVGDVFGRFMEIVGQKALDVPRGADGIENVGTVMQLEDGGDGEDEEEEEFEDARDDLEQDVYADLPPRDFDVIIDVDSHDADT
ncbi:hypothetical protein TWF696_009692 [Orbilia brochopaga]|uniref:WD40 repeat-like protein n=1 Tax=Orbilia brochopaga TaxID=3140254 RepID=A0AAV9UFM7_9PEZI